jgi:Zn-dependent peptidase ImmA (M78 family)
MNVQVERIASDDNFIRMYQNGVSRQDLANYFGVPYQTINQVVEYMGLLPVNKNDLAPSPEEDKYSRENLMLSPRVFAAAEEYRQKYEKRKEAETAQCTYNRQYKLNLKRSLL